MPVEEGIDRGILVPLVLYERLADVLLLKRHAKLHDFLDKLILLAR